MRWKWLYSRILLSCQKYEISCQCTANRENHIIQLCSYVFHSIYFVIYGVYGHAPRINNIQIIYYYFSLVVFLIGLTWVTSALAVFTKDTLSVVNLIVQVGFWATPIVWSMDMMPATVQKCTETESVF